MPTQNKGPKPISPKVINRIPQIPRKYASLRMVDLTAPHSCVTLATVTLGSPAVLEQIPSGSATFCPYLAAGLAFVAAQYTR